MVTKTFSTKQEKMIADYLGWQTVAASGARDFCPGDVCSPEWLGECKTHVQPRDRILVDAKVWNKIRQEALSVFKQPVLFVDDGTQKADHTWCVFESRFVSGRAMPQPLNLPVRVNLVFRHSQLYSEYSYIQRSFDRPVVVPFNMGGNSLGLMPLYSFRELVV